MKIPALFENDDVIAVYKPEGIAVIPESAGGRPCLLSTLESVRREKLYVVHRIDKDVSGVVLLARNEAAHRNLNDQFLHQKVRKTYLLLAHGTLENSEGVIDKPIRRYGSGRMGVDWRRGKPSVTRFQVIDRYPGCTLLRAHPITGRRHQIRVHLYSIGHPIVGDRRYGDREVQSAFPRLMLHALEIAVLLPSGEEIQVEAPVPDSWTSTLERFR